MKTLVWICATLIAAPAFSASSSSQEIQVSSVTLSDSGSELELGFVDRSPVSSACDYFVSRFEYLAVTEPASLLIELRAPEPCLIDNFGRRSGRLRWTLPTPLRGAGRLSIILNNRDAGEVFLSGTSVHFIAH